MSTLTLQTLCERKDPSLRLLVIGDPIEHSLSPPMHNAGLEFLHLPYLYGRLRVSPENLQEAFQILRQQDFIGWNLTLPHKLLALDLLDGLDPLAEQLRAVNTVVNQSGRLFGFNTDGQGTGGRDRRIIRVYHSFRSNRTSGRGWRSRPGSGSLLGGTQCAVADFVKSNNSEGRATGCRTRR